MSKILVAGSIAYDHLMTFDGEFKDSLLAGKDLKNLSVSFLANSENFSFGGCAPNICYSLSLLGDSSSIVGIAGVDFPRYEKWLNEKGIGTDFIRVDQVGVTAAAYVLTDKNQGQITIFYPGVINDKKLGFDLGKFDPREYKYSIVSPELPDRMYYWAKHFKESGIPYIFDPGQAIPALTKEQLLEMSHESNAMIFNEYEGSLIESKLGISFEELAKNKDFMVKTLGMRGCQVYAGEIFNIPAIPNLKEVDSTGCGDAFRAGVLHGITNGFDLKRACEMGNTVASFVIGERGTQNHYYTMEVFMDRLVKNYGEA
ncbi:MAG: carbohydrate kinase family protein [Candidatus Gracilibacteria bacterium]|jgi:adenosine kinase